MNQSSVGDSKQFIEANSQQEIELIKARSILSSLESQVEVQKTMVSRRKDQTDKLYQEHNSMMRQKAEKERERRDINMVNDQIKYLRQQIDEVKREKAEHEDQYALLMQQPFLKKLDGNTHRKNLNELKVKSAEMQNEMRII